MGSETEFANPRLAASAAGAVSRPGPIPTAVVHPCDVTALQAAVEAAMQGLIIRSWLDQRPRSTLLRWRRLSSFKAGPMQQPLGVEGVVDPALVAGRRAKPDLRRAIPDRLPIGGGLLAARPVLLGDVFGDVLALGRHAGIEFEGLEMEMRLDEGAEPPQGLLKTAQSDDAPGTGNIRNKVDLERLWRRRIFRKTTA
jgi:hypothetical protein